MLAVRFPLIILAVVSFISGCTKIDTTTIGQGLLPIVDNINTFEETYDVVTKNYTNLKSDSTYIFTSEPHVLGHIDDPVFGKTTANMYIQVLPGSLPYTYPVASDSMHFDSAVLVLKYSGVYGDSLAPQKINVFRVVDDSFLNYRKDTDTTFVSKTYRLNEDVQYNSGELLGSAYMAPADMAVTRILSYKKDSVSTSQLRIRLDDNFGKSFLQQTASGAFLNDTTFLNFIRGFALVPEASAGGNGLMYFQTTADTKLLIYHRTDLRDGTKDTTVETFSAGSGITANYVARDRSAGEIASHLDNDLPDNVMYLQGAPGTYARVTIPGLENLSNRVVHRAELIVKQIWNGPQAIEDNLYPTPLIYTEVFNTDSNRVMPADSLIFNPYLTSVYSSDFFSYVGGHRTDTTDGAHIVARYNVNLTRYVQAIITRRFKNYPLQLTIPYKPDRFILENNSYLITPYTPLASGRLKAGGGGHPLYKMYMRIIYSKIQ